VKKNGRFTIAGNEPVRILSEPEWAERHGSSRVSGGRLTAATTTDYMAASCPQCGTLWQGGFGVGLEGVKLDPDLWMPNGVLFRLACRACELRDFFKFAVDNSGALGTPQVCKPSQWRREGRPKKP
jgi:hypothetical protein